jgi:hypothetical protein
MTWLESLSVGAKVVVDSGARSEEIGTVSRVTPTQIVVDGRRFRRRDGYAVGGNGWYRTRLREATPEAVHQIRMRVVRCRLSNVQWDVLSDARCMAVLTLLNAGESECTPGDTAKVGECEGRGATS